MGCLRIKHCFIFLNVEGFSQQCRSVQLKRNLRRFPCTYRSFRLVSIQQLNWDADLNSIGPTPTWGGDLSWATNEMRFVGGMNAIQPRSDPSTVGIVHCWSKPAPTACSHVLYVLYHYYCITVIVVFATYVSPSELLRAVCHPWMIWSNMLLTSRCLEVLLKVPFSLIISAWCTLWL